MNYGNQAAYAPNYNAQRSPAAAPALANYGARGLVGAPGDPPMAETGTVDKIKAWAKKDSTGTGIPNGALVGGAVALGGIAYAYYETDLFGKRTGGGSRKRASSSRDRSRSRSRRRH